MQYHLLGAAAVILSLATMVSIGGPTTKATSVLDFSLSDIHDKPVDMSKYKGKVLLIVNTASKCGKTPQYAGLEKLHEAYGEQGLAVLGFPCNDFAGQDPKSNAEILGFCQETYKVKFDMFSKVKVKGDEKTPIYDFLISKDTNPKFGGDIKWNFTKFLVGRDGKVVARFEPGVTPESDEVVKAIKAELEKK